MKYQDLKRNDEVLVLLDSGEEKVFKVKHAPWQLGDGTWVVGLYGISGGYSLARVKDVRSK